MLRLCALHFLAGADALHVLRRRSRRGRAFGNGAWSSALATCWHGWRRAPRGDVCRAARESRRRVRGRRRAERRESCRVCAGGAAKAAASAAAASAAFPGHVSADIGLAIVGVWFARAPPSWTRPRRDRARHTGDEARRSAAPRRRPRAARARRLPFAARRRGGAPSALNPSGAFGAELGTADVVLAAPSARRGRGARGDGDASRRGADPNGRGSTTVSEANVALFAAAATLSPPASPRGAPPPPPPSRAAARSRRQPRWCAGDGGRARGLLRRAAARAGHRRARRRQGREGGLLFRGFNPRAALAFAAGAAFPLADFAATAEIGARMVNVVGPGVQTILAPNRAGARRGPRRRGRRRRRTSRSTGGAPPRVAAGGGAARGRGGAARVIAADGVATGTAVDDAGIGERRFSRRTPRPWAAREGKSLPGGKRDGERRSRP